MAIKFQYNKTSLQQLEKQLKVRVRTLPIIKNKESALRMEVKRCKSEARRAAACAATTLALARSAEGGTWNGRAQQNHRRRQQRKRSAQHGQAHYR